MLLREVVTTSAAVAAVGGRRDKITEIARLLARVPPGEVPIAVAYLSGTLRQRQTGVGYAALAGLPGAQAVQADGAGADGLTLTEVDRVLGEVAAAAGDGVQARRRSLIGALFDRASGDERRFLVRLIAGELGQGAGEGIMIDAVAAAAGVPASEVRRAHQLAGWLPEVASAALAGGTGALRGITLRPGRPVRPMLAASAPDVGAALARISPAVLEWKIDGIRVQIHVTGDQIGVFTRTLDDITTRVPEIVAVARSLRVASAVLDGEAVALRPDGRPQPFQLTSARAATRQDGATGPGASGAAAAPLSVFLFDVLHVDGEDLMEEPEDVRFARLASIAPAASLIPRLVTSEPGEAGEFFAEALRHGHEGVVVKSPAAPYRTGRRGGDWIKVKPRETLDLVILAAEWGHGRRTGLLSNLHLGARDPATGGFVMLGKTFKGLTDATLSWQTSRLLELSGQPAAAPGDRPYGVVRVRPELVAEIAFDGVQASSRYPGGVTLRFARVLRYRTDKSAGEADTIATVRDLWNRAAQ